jgi:hypothetical protein
MKILEALNRAVRFGQDLSHIMITTADRTGLPHVAAAGEVNVDAAGLLYVTGWYCPTTVENLQDNRLVSLVIWDPEADIGYQVTGEVEDIREKAVLNGYGPEADESSSMPQVERELHVRAKEVFLFCHAPHTDRVMNETTD